MKWIILLAAATAAPALAQQPQPVCVQKAVVPGFERWGSGNGEALAAGAWASLRLQPAAGVAFVPPPARAPEAGSFGGVFPLEVKDGGTWRIALGGKAWIEVVRDGQRLASTAHQEGPACSGIRKIVAFDLKPGTYLVQLSEAREPNIAAMVAQ